MRTLSSELGAHVTRKAVVPRIYADANFPTGAIEYMRVTLGWDVFFVLEHDDLRRAPDIQHFRLARQLGRTLVTLDRDYIDDRRFPPAEGAGLIVFVVPDERWLRRLLNQADRELFRADHAPALPLEGQKLLRHVGDGASEAAGEAARSPHRVRRRPRKRLRRDASRAGND